MNKESQKAEALIDYIFDYCIDFWTEYERLAFRHYSSVVKMHNLSEEQQKNRTQVLLQRGWMTENTQVLQLLQNGFDEFKTRLVNRIIQEHQNEIVFNRCPNCQGIARTPQAKQCRWCGHDWH